MAAIDDVLAKGPILTAAELPARVEEIEGALPVADGVAWFCRLYRVMGRDINAAVAAGAFTKPAFIDTLDVVFVNLFLDALRTYGQAPERTPRAWRPLFEARARADLAPIQFALAGMNAHINRDLPVALLQTFQRLGIAMARPSVESADYDAVNAVIQKAEADAKEWFDTGFTEVVDEALGHVDDVLAIWSVEAARRAAWTNGEALRALGGEPRIATEYLAVLDRMVGFAGRGLLLPITGQ